MVDWREERVLDGREVVSKIEGLISDFCADMRLKYKDVAEAEAEAEGKTVSYCKKCPLYKYCFR